ncbi:restriction endonuclease subunit S [Moritella yayanosii]|uniref:Putative Type I restriction endonuclease subunit S HsdS n=1 Tax=Moritella yayanosii TaxID=69539 RepID=A0A330LMM3_9GAMM|nr:restriction endonuclease subunit S [Moritella yayanosii]SQD77933.1 putative Type I restriction endonuclease subunit S HsdS [Moritella yayanosii]
MGNDWKNCELGDVIELKRGYDLPKTKRIKGGVPVVSSSGTSGEHNAIKVAAPGVVTGRYGTIGEVFYIEDDFWPLNTTLYVRDFKGNDPLYVYYLLKTIRYSDYTDKGAVPGINRNHIHKAKVKVPICPKYQRTLAINLFDLDKKVELNRQTNQTLELMAQALFKSWFVDFDPVFDNLLAKIDFKLENLASDLPAELLKNAQKRLHALQERALQQSCDLHALLAESQNNIHSHFPSEFEFSEQIGWIPKGWEETTIDELCRINPQSWTKKNAPKAVKYVDLANAKNGAIGEIANYTFDDAPSRARRILQPHDTIIGVVRPANRSFAYVNEEGLTGSTGFVVVRAKKENYRAFSYLALTNEDCIKEFTRIADGAAYPAIKPEDVAKAECVFSSDAILDKFEYTVGALMKKIAANEQQITPLISLRDTLLPKLISGELQIPDVVPA